MMIKHASKIIFVDSTHNTTQYDFLLTTISILDELEEACPVAWAISNREDKDLLKIFMQSLRDSCGIDFKINIFMSDMANNFYNAWCDTFSKPIHRLYCSWHVDRNWRKNIFKYIKAQEDQYYAYAYLKTLQIETNEGRFRKMLQEYLGYLQGVSPNFLNYFQNTYVNCDQILLWAACFRIGTLANTNMYSEAFHRVLKCVYFNKRQNKRVDHLLAILLKYSKDKAYEQLLKVEKGKLTHRLRNVRTRHKNSEKISNIIEIKADEEWTINSTEHQGSTYIIKMYKKDCSCTLKCDFCQVCAHLYTCTCPDFLIYSISCKHIHAVHTKKTKSINSHSDMIPDETANYTVMKPEFLGEINTHCCNNLEKGKKSISITIQKIQDLVSICDDADAINAIESRLEDAFVIGSALNKESLPEKSKFNKKKIISSTQKIETVRRFFSTKRKRSKKNKLSLKKPSDINKESLTTELSKNYVFVCAVCFREDDDSDTTDVNWFECLKCKCWVHVACFSKEEQEFNKDNPICSICY